MLDRLLLSERRGAGVGTVFGFHPRNDRVVHALAAGGQLGPAGRTPAGGTRLAAQNGQRIVATIANQEFVRPPDSSHDSLLRARRLEGDYAGLREKLAVCDPSEAMGWLLN